MKIPAAFIFGLTLRSVRTNLLLWLFLGLFMPSAGYSQLTSFILTVTVTPETCSGNGALQFTTSNTTAGSSIIFSIYHLPDVTTPVSIQSTNSLAGQVAGDYLVVATQTLGSATNTEEEQVTIVDLIIDLEFVLEGHNSVCGLDGEIEVNVTQGQGVSYEIFSGPVIVPPQPSNVLTGLSAGIYQVRVFDACGEGVVQTYELFDSNAGLLLYVQSPTAGDCDTLLISLTLSASANSVVAFPLTVHCVVTTPTGEQLVFDQIITTSSGGAVTYSEEIPYFEGEIYSYTVTVTDHCGNVYNSASTISNFSVDPIASMFNSTCTSSGLYIHNVIALTLLTAPSAYQGLVPADLTPIIDENHLATLTNLPIGTYTFLATGLCGQLVPLTVTITPPEPTVPGVSVREGCEIGFGSLLMYGSYQSVIMTSAPASFTTQLPQDLTSILDPFTGSLAMNTLPQGAYGFHTTDMCGYEFDVTVNIQGYEQSTSVAVIENCNSFNLNLSHVSNVLSATFWLQKYDSVNDEWEHPGTGSVYVDGTIPNTTNSIQVASNAITYNLGYTGQFRIMKFFTMFNQGQSGAIACTPVLYEFEFTPGPKILNVYSLACTNNTYDLIVEATGLQPLIYRITSKNGAPFFINNNNTSIFLGLDPALYNIQVEDSCGNILNRLFDIPTPFPLAITAATLCNGQSGSLTVPYFPFLDYSWWKGTDITNVLSTTGSLQFSPFDAATDEGTYHVRITYDNPGSCIDIILDFEILPGASNPEAGTGTSISYCDRPASIDLYSLLTPPFNSGGVWQNTSGTGTLTGSDWSASGIPAGTYQFNYTVTGLCASDVATVTIILNPTAEFPDVQSNIVVCSGSDINLSVSTILGTSYNWTGPNNFSSTDTAPTLTNATTAMSGTYYVTGTLGSCTSLPASVEVNVIPPPEFTLIPGCDDNRFTIGVAPTDSSLIMDSATFLWTGPEGYTTSGNPINITGEIPGTYTVNVITEDGCSGTSSIQVAATLCGIPLGISPNGDGLNDNWNLAGFFVKNLKIFNRYGVTVYEQDNYRSEWHGQDYKNRDLPAGAYYFLIDLPEGDMKSGWVYVNREF